MNSFPADILTSPYALRALRDLDLEALPQIFPESGSFGPSLANRRDWMKQVENIAWGKNPNLRVVMEDSATGRAIAGFTFERTGDVLATLRYGFRPSSAMTQVAGFLMAKNLAFDELGLIALRTDMISGQDPLAQIHEQIGFREAVRMRQFWRDSQENLHDLITYEAVNPEYQP